MHSHRQLPHPSANLVDLPACGSTIITMEWQEWTAVADDPSLWKNREEKGLLKAEYVGDYALIWPNPETGAYDEQAIDMAPECVRFFCEKYGRPVKTLTKNRTTSSAR